MNKLVIFLLLALLIACKETPKPISDSRQNDYALYDSKGDFHRFSYYNDQKAIVIMVQGNGCPVVRNAISDYNAIIDDFTEKGFKFFYINSNTQDDRTKIEKEASDFNLKVPILLDQTQLIADEFDINITSEIFILNPTTRKIIYRGPINNRLDIGTQKNAPTETYLRDALNSIDLKKELVENVAMATGCKVTRLKNRKKEKSITYTSDIAPILNNYCVKCHREDGIGPWNMDGHKTIKGWSSMIEQVLISKRMPPWKADPTIGSFTNDFSMPEEDARKILNWIDNGMPYGEGEDILKNIPRDTIQWENGTPDEIVVLTEEQIPATGQLPYRHQRFTIKNHNKAWIKAIDIKPGNSKVVHHVVINDLSGSLESPITDRPMLLFNDDIIAVAGSNNQLIKFPEDTGVLVSEKADLTIQMHYTTTGKPEVDQTQLGIYYHDSIPAHQMRALAPTTRDFEIPAFAKNVVLSAQDLITKDILIHNVIPHMHYRGKSIKLIVIDPDGNEKTLISVPDFNFNWQQLYQLETPAKVKKGSIVKIEGIYDNSYQNPLNPDPTVDLNFGKQSSDEMLIGFYNYTIDE